MNTNMKFLSPERCGVLCAIASGLCYGLMGYFGISILDSGSSVYNMMFWRYASSSLFMAILLMKYGSVKESLKTLVRAALMGGLIYSLGSIAYFISGKLIGTGLAMVIFFVFPAMVVLINRLFYKILINRIYYLALGLILLGIVLLADIGESSIDVVGIGFAVISAFFYAIYIVLSKDNKMPPVLSTFMVSIGCAFACFLFALTDDSFFVPTNLAVWVDICGIGIICTAIPILLLLESLKYISSEKAAIFSVLEPVFTVIFGMILLGEMISFKQGLGIALLLIGALATLIPKKISKKLSNNS